jgi:hypothetical protein
VLLDEDLLPDKPLVVQIVHDRPDVIRIEFFDGASQPSFASTRTCELAVR